MAILKIHELENNQVVRARWARAFDHPTIEWTPWADVEIYVQRSPDTKKKKSQVCIITLRGIGAWADHDPRHDWNRPFGDDPNGTFVTEDYYLQIDGLEQEYGK